MNSLKVTVLGGLRFDLTSRSSQVGWDEGAVEYTDCISVEGYDPPNECPKYDTKPPNGEAQDLGIWEM